MKIIYILAIRHTHLTEQRPERLFLRDRSSVPISSRKDVKAIVIACNTATSVAASTLRQQYPSIPIIGIEPALKPAVLWKEHDKVAVMATPATLALPKFQELMKVYSKESDIYPVPCPGLADYVEREF